MRHIIFLPCYLHIAFKSVLVFYMNQTIITPFLHIPTFSLLGSELCTVVETMFSHEVMFYILGDPKFAERAEQLAYNALPATLTPDMWAHQYLQQSNEMNAIHSVKHVWTHDGPDSTLWVNGSRNNPFSGFYLGYIVVSFAHIQEHNTCNLKLIRERYKKDYW